MCRLPILALLPLPFFSLQANSPPAPSQFSADPRLTFQLWAAEPDVVDPVSIAFDESGRAYVAECRDYPYGVGPDGKVGSTVRLLEDRDRDGKVDHSTVFASDLSYATSVTPWRGGILVAAAPDILFLKDTDGDGIADIREILVSGFRRGVSDSLVNGLRFGLDNRIHGANGGNGGRLLSPKLSADPVQLADHDFALDPDSGRIFLTGRSGGGFGLVQDNWGRWFTTYNIDHIQHRFMDRSHVHGRPGLPSFNTTASISDHGEMARIFPVSVAVTRPNHPEQSGHFSAAGGMGFLGSSSWPSDLQGAVFVCDVVGNLVHREVIHPNGAVFVASRAPDESHREFIASQDPRFRPVGLEMGPDGALYLLDMHREVIEHPDYIPARVREKQDIRAGTDRGRIWRITHRNWTQPATPATRDLQKNSFLVSLLGHGDAWWRLTAQRLLVERQALDVVPDLRRILTVPQTDPLHALHRLHALWTLNGLGQLQSSDIASALTDPVTGIRENTLQLAQPHLPDRSSLIPLVRSQLSHPSPRIRFHAALALSNIGGEETRNAFTRLLKQDLQDPWIQRAVLAATLTADKSALVQSLLADSTFLSHPSAPGVMQQWAEALAADPGIPASTWPQLIPQITPTTPRPIRFALVQGLNRGFQRLGSSPDWPASVKTHWESIESIADDEELAALWNLLPTGPTPPSAQRLQRLSTARSAATNLTLSVPHRTGAIALLSQDTAAAPTLLRLMDSVEPTEIQKAAFQIFRNQRDPAAGSLLVARWKSFGPTLRPSVLQLLLERRPFHEPLVAALESLQLTPGELNLDLEQRRRLLRGSSPGIAARAGKFFSDEEYSNRNRIVDEWLARLPSSGDPARGRTVFQESCAQCHRCADLGFRVGPDLSGVAHRSIEDLLGNILDPNMAINPGFISFLVETRDGDSHTGLLGSESPDSITLLQAAGQSVLIPRRDIVRMESTGNSLMPAGLEEGRSPQDLRDLIAFLQATR
jgi:putative membrane-bound dehydrogenase-like protein